jgi:PAS domain S-box-containing protein
MEHIAENYRTLVMRAENGICQMDAELVIRFANPFMFSALGCADGDELVGEKFLDIIDPPDRRKVIAKYAKRKQGIAERYELSFRRKDGSVFPASLSAVPLFDEGVFSGSFAIIKDMTRQKLLLDQLRASEARFRDLAEQLPAAICELAPDSTIRYLNDFARFLFGLAGKRRPPRLSLRHFIPENALPRFDRILRETLAGSALQPFSMDLLSPTGDRLPALWSAAPIERRNRAAGVRVVVIDIKEMLSSAIVRDDDLLARYGLSDRERSVAKLLVAGLLYKEIAFRLRISLPTVRTHSQSLYRKMGIHSRSELVDIAFRLQTGDCGEDTFMQLFRRALLLHRSII